MFEGSISTRMQNVVPTSFSVEMQTQSHCRFGIMYIPVPGMKCRCASHVITTNAPPQSSLMLPLHSFGNVNRLVTSYSGIWGTAINHASNDFRSVGAEWRASSQRPRPETVPRAEVLPPRKWR
jgi:hypothetical protein